VKGVTGSPIRWAVLALLYAVFTVWYGGSGDSLTAEETERFVGLAEVREPQFADAIRKLAGSDDGGEFVMVNLNAYREEPEYADGREVEGTAEEIENRYLSKMVPRLLARACHPLVAVTPIVHLGSGEGERFPWDRATMVRYRSRRDFLEIILTTDFDQDVDHKWAALLRSHSFPSTPRISFVTMRLLPFLFLVSLGLLLDRIFDRRR